MYAGMKGGENNNAEDMGQHARLLRRIMCGSDGRGTAWSALMYALPVPAPFDKYDWNPVHSPLKMSRSTDTA